MLQVRFETDALIDPVHHRNTRVLRRLDPARELERAGADGGIEEAVALVQELLLGEDLGGVHAEHGERRNEWRDEGDAELAVADGFESFDVSGAPGAEILGAFDSAEITVIVIVQSSD